MRSIGTPTPHQTGVLWRGSAGHATCVHVVLACREGRGKRKHAKSPAALQPACRARGNPGPQRHGRPTTGYGREEMSLPQWSEVNARGRSGSVKHLTRVSAGASHGPRPRTSNSNAHPRRPRPRPRLPPCLRARRHRRRPRPRLRPLVSLPPPRPGHVVLLSLPTAAQAPPSRPGAR